MPEDGLPFLKTVGSFFENLFSFILILLIAVFILFALGWIIRVCFGGETTSQYFGYFMDFYRHPEQTEMGQGILRVYKRMRD